MGMMKISPIISPTCSQNYNVENRNVSNSLRINTKAQISSLVQTTDLANMPCYKNLDTEIKSSKRISAEQYLKDRKKQFDISFWSDSISDYNLDKLDGIQEGIKVLEGLNMKEIAYFADTFTAIATTRGCRNGCSHCYRDGKPEIKTTEDQTGRMSWEDFTSFVDGFEELNKRLGFSIFDESGSHTDMQELFYDSDSANLYVKDKNGNIYDFVDMHEKIEKIRPGKMIFDTAGWFPTDKRAQTRAEKYVQYYSDPDNMDKIFQFNVSIHPFEGLNDKAVQFMLKGEKDKEEKFREFYTTKMANVFFTFTPLLNSDNFIVFPHAMSQLKDKHEGYTVFDLKGIYSGILKKLEALYEKDYHSESPKFIKNKSDIENNLNKLEEKMIICNSLTNIAETGRYKKRFPENVTTDYRNMMFNPSEMKKTDKMRTYVDANGKIFLANNFQVIETELQFNFENKHKKTAPLEPNLHPEKLTRERINSFYP